MTDTNDEALKIFFDAEKDIRNGWHLDSSEQEWFDAVSFALSLRDSEKHRADEAEAVVLKLMGHIRLIARRDYWSERSEEIIEFAEELASKFPKDTEAREALIVLNTMADGFVACQPDLVSEKPWWEKREAARKVLSDLIAAHDSEKRRADEAEAELARVSKAANYLVGLLDTKDITKSHPDLLNAKNIQKLDDDIKWAIDNLSKTAGEETYDGPERPDLEALSLPTPPERI